MISQEPAPSMIEPARTLPVHGDLDVVVTGGGAGGLTASSGAAGTAAAMVLPSESFANLNVKAL